MTRARFRFKRVKPLIDGDLTLLLHERLPRHKQWPPAYRFKMVASGHGEVMGSIELRVGDSFELIQYAGQIGYGVFEKYRGNHYAARACRLLLPLAGDHGLNPLWITCNPDNVASRRTCELAGGTLVEVVDLPEDSEMYLSGDRQKCRYRFDL